MNERIQPDVFSFAQISGILKKELAIHKPLRFALKTLLVLIFTSFTPGAGFRKVVVSPNREVHVVSDPLNQ